MLFLSDPKEATITNDISSFSINHVHDRKKIQKIKTKVFFYLYAMPDSTMKVSRMQIPYTIAQKFIRDYDEVVALYNQEDKLVITTHLLEVITLQQQYLKTDEENFYKQFLALEKSLLEQYGAAFKPYLDKQFSVYFDAELVLAEKEIYSSEQFNDLRTEEQRLTLAEMAQFIFIVTNTLERERNYLLLASNSTLNDNESLPINGNNEEESDKDATKARQLLAIYYLLKTTGIEHRESNAVSSVARLIHLLTGTKYTNIQNSSIYKKYLLMPNYKTGEPLLKDLQFIRTYFERIDMVSTITLIDEEINRCIQELPLSLRKKWHDR